jgi:ribonuclease P protein component
MIYASSPSVIPAKAWTQSNKNSARRVAPIALNNKEHRFVESLVVLGPGLRRDDGSSRENDGAKDNSINYLKIAYVVSKKISPKAVIRNKIKRRMRAVVRQLLKDKEEQFNALKTTLLVSIRASSNKIIDTTFQQIQSEIKQSFEQVI